MPLADDPACLELSIDEMQVMARAAVDRVIGHLGSLSEQPARGPLDGVAELCRAMREPPPEEPSELDALLGPLFDEWVPRSFNTAGPGYLAFIPGGGLFPSAVAGFIAESVNRYTGLWNAAPALIQLEVNALDWLRQWMDMPSSTRGLLTTGGSLATFAAVIAARERHLGSAIREGVAYSTQHAHHCVGKSLRLAGIFPDRVRIIGVDERFRMRADLLADAIAADRGAGLRPFLVMSTAGTTNTGAIDPLSQIAEVCEAERLWHHVDGAYGGFFHLVSELQGRLAGLSRADSLALDPHKGLFLPYGVGAVLVRDGDALKSAHSVSAGYLPFIPDDAYSPSDHGPELTRDYRGLRLWLPLKLFGAARFRAALREKHMLTVWACEQLAAIDAIAIDAEPALSLFAFHVRGASLAEENATTRELVERVTARGRVMITGATVGDRFMARICVLSFRTRREHVEHAVEDILDAARALHGRT